MGRVETLLALLAVILASVAALPVRGRLLFAIVAIVLIAVVGMMRIRAALANRRLRPSYDPYERAARIREERRSRLGR